MTERILITGANRGIGMATVREYLKQNGVHIFATCRNPDSAQELQSLAQHHPNSLTIIPLEVTDQSSIEMAFKSIAAKVDGLDIVINNAGINPPGQSFSAITAQLMLRVLEVNTVAPVMIAKAAFELLKNGSNPRLVHISSDMGSLSQRTYGGDYGYCSSKAALNMAMRGMAVDLRRFDITTVALDPGWVQTDMGGTGASLKPEESAQGIVKVISGLTANDSGRYLAYDGSEHPW
jgi:NAD(P)-dependent dehydrogenase (short-subunit alcohol dehydrogenase family)